jgi:hypothetical protein
MKTKILATALTLLLTQSMLSAKVYAIVNGDNLTDTDIKPMLQMFGAKSVDELDENKKKVLLDQSIEKKLIAQKAISDKVDQDPEFKRVVKDFRNRLLVDFWMKKKFDNIKVSDDELKKYLEDNKKSYPKGTKLDNDLRDKAKMSKFQKIIDEKLSIMKKDAKIEYK